MIFAGLIASAAVIGSVPLLVINQSAWASVYICIWNIISIFAARYIPILLQRRFPNIELNHVYSAQTLQLLNTASTRILRGLVSFTTFAVGYAVCGYLGRAKHSSLALGSLSTTMMAGQVLSAELMLVLFGVSVMDIIHTRGTVYRSSSASSNRVSSNNNLDNNTALARAVFGANPVPSTTNSNAKMNPDDNSFLRKHGPYNSIATATAAATDTTTETDQEHHVTGRSPDLALAFVV